MARITVEDCIDKFPSRFELVLVASQRSRKLHSGDEPTVDKDNDKNTVIALREIADSTISVEQMKENLIQEYQTVTINDEEEENIELENSENKEIESDETKETASDETKETASDETKETASDETKETALNTTNEVEEEMNNLIKSEDSEIEEQYEITDATTEESPVQDNEENQEKI